MSSYRRQLFARFTIEDLNCRIRGNIRFSKNVPYGNGERHEGRGGIEDSRYTLKNRLYLSWPQRGIGGVSQARVWSHDAALAFFHFKGSNLAYYMCRAYKCN